MGAEPRSRDERPSWSLSARGIVLLARTRPLAYLVGLATTLVVALGAPRWFGGGTAVGALVLVTFLAYGVGLASLAIAVARDRDRKQRGGRGRALLVILTGGLAALPWALEEERGRRASSGRR